MKIHNRPQLIALDVDDTLFTEKLYYTGEDLGSEKTLRRLVAEGHKLMLFTRREDKDLIDVLRWFKFKNIPLVAINSAPFDYLDDRNIRKPPFDILIDDKALGAPMRKTVDDRWVINWTKVEEMLEELGILNPTYNENMQSRGM